MIYGRISGPARDIILKKTPKRGKCFFIAKARSEPSVLFVYFVPLAGFEFTTADIAGKVDNSQIKHTVINDLLTASSLRFFKTTKFYLKSTNPIT